MPDKINAVFTEIENKIFTIRGLSVMLDSDLAKLYGVETKRINEAVKRNINRFPDWFMFQMTFTEWENLRLQIGTSNNEGENSSRSQFATLNENKHTEVENLRSQIATSSMEYGGRRYLPFAFTEQGVAMLSAVLKSETAIKVSIQIMATFVEMRKIHIRNAGLFQRLEMVEQKQVEADNHFNKIFTALEKNNVIPEQGIFYNGQIFDAYLFVTGIVKSARKSIILLDNYIDETTLAILTKRKSGIQAIIYTENFTKIQTVDWQKLCKQYESIEIRKLKNNHDRFLIIDRKEMYHIGASLKDLGKKIFGFSKMDAECHRLLELLDE